MNYHFTLIVPEALYRIQHRTNPRVLRLEFKKKGFRDLGDAPPKGRTQSVQRIIEISTD